MNHKFGELDLKSGHCHCFVFIADRREISFDSMHWTSTWRTIRHEAIPLCQH